MEEMETTVDNFPEWFDAGYNKVKISLEDQDGMINKVARHFVISQCHEEIQEVIAGLNDIGVLQCLKQFPDDAIQQLTPSDDLTSESILKFLNVVYSPQGSNRKVKEEDIIYNLCNFLEQLQEGSVSCQTVDLSDVNDIKGVKLSLNDILQFLTGARHFCSVLKKGEIEFNHEASEGKKLEVGTCAFRLSIPCKKRYSESAVAFIHNITENIISSPGFGKIRVTDIKQTIGCMYMHACWHYILDAAFVNILVFTFTLYVIV